MSHTSAMLRSPIRLRYDDEDDDASHCNTERMPCDVFSPYTQPQDARRSSFIAHSNNGKTKHRSNEKTRDGISPIVANETCIWLPAYSGKRKKCYSARIIRTTCILDKKLPCRFRVHNETDTDAVYYPELKSFQKQMYRDILPEERVCSRDEKSSFVESCVWMTYSYKRNGEVLMKQYIEPRKI